MLRTTLSAAVLGIVFFSGAGTGLAQTASTERHLVYDFTVGVQTSNTSQTSAAQETQGGNVPGYGYNDMAAGDSDKGQISVDVKGVEADGGLVVDVSETSVRSNRGSAASTCVVYPNTNVMCGAADVHPEAVSVLRTLSPKFFDPGALDANRHWQVSNPAAGVTIDFRAGPSAGGPTVTIDAERVEKYTNGSSVNSNAKYAYDLTKLVPTSLTEYQTIRQQNGAGAYSTVTFDTTATLVSDSGSGKS